MLQRCSAWRRENETFMKMLFPSCTSCLSKRSRQKPRNHLLKETTRVLLLLVSLGPDFPCEDFECEPTPWFMSLTFLFHCISNRPIEAPMRVAESELDLRGLEVQPEAPPSDMRNFFAMSLEPLNRKHALFSFSSMRSPLCNSSHHPYSPTGSIKLMGFSPDDTKAI